MKICVIGEGNVGTHMCVAFAGAADEVISVNSRTLEDFPSDFDLYLLCVADSAITEVASKLPGVKGIVAHTSGSVPLSALDCVAGEKGVFYPLMTFSRDADLDYSKIPVFVEGSTEKAAGTLAEAARLFTDKVVEMDSSRRMKMHVASVFACNFVNALWQVSFDLMEQEGVPFRYLLPLIDATASKLSHLTPREAQTGPARRGDMAVIEKHAALLDSQPMLKRIYQDLTQLIITQANDRATEGKEDADVCD